MGEGGQNEKSDYRKHYRYGYGVSRGMRNLRCAIE